MRIAIPRERKQGECRVAMTPEGAKQLTTLGHDILIEKEAGIKSGFLDSEYQSAGAKIVSSLETLWKQAELLVKVKEPAPEEFAYFREDLSVFSFLHPAAFNEMVSALVKSKTLSISYDLVITDDGRLPILEPMSIIAGKLSVQCGAMALESCYGGRGLLLGGTPSISPAKVVIVGAGASGKAAAEVASGMGADVCILDINAERLKKIASLYPNVKTELSSPVTLLQQIKTADLLIGAVLVPGALAPKLITREMVKQMLPGAVIVDISIDQGGFAETSRPSSIAVPTYIEENIVHYCVPNMPALVPRTSTLALTTETLPWIMKLAGGVIPALRANTALSAALVTQQGLVKNKEVASALGYKL